MQFYNTSSKKIETFKSQTTGKVLLYTCGPTVYDRLHVGNWAAYIYWDILVRSLKAHGYQVERVLNITDVGHLTSDEDEGQDKLQRGAERENKTAWQIAQNYTTDFLNGFKQLQLLEPTYWALASDYIEQQLELVTILKSKNLTYQIDDGIYFDTSKFAGYQDFAKLDLENQQSATRTKLNPQKRNPSDFALWKFSPSDQKRDMEWPTPPELLESGSVSKMGFPGWHLECSAIAHTLLGSHLDIHAGGIDHIPVHHSNEIAQSESAYGAPLSYFWLHNNHLKVDGTKISKSLQNGFSLQDLTNRGFSVFDFKLFVLQSHYRSEGNFSFANLASARARRLHWRNLAALRHQTHQTIADQNEDSYLLAASGVLKQTLADDLNTPEALKFIDQTFSRVEKTNPQKISAPHLQHFLEQIDELLGFDLIASSPDIDEQIKRLIIARKRARENADWQRADQLRQEIAEQGIELRDYEQQTIWQYA